MNERYKYDGLDVVERAAISMVMMFILAMPVAILVAVLTHSLVTCLTAGFIAFALASYPVVKIVGTISDIVGKLFHIHQRVDELNPEHD